MFVFPARLRGFLRPGLWFASFLFVLLSFPGFSEAGQPTPDEAPVQIAPVPITPPDYTDTGLSADDVDHDALRPSYARGIEWAGVSFGGLFLFEHTKYSAAGARRLDLTILKMDLLFFNLYSDNFYMTLLEVHPTILIGLLGGGLRAGYRIPLAPDFREEFRVGSYLGLDVIGVDVAAAYSARSGINLMPHVQYIVNMSQFSVGFGLDVPIIFLLGQGCIRRHDTHLIMGGVMLYFRLGFGRTFRPTPEDGLGIERGSFPDRKENQPKITRRHGYDLLQER